MPLLQLLQCEGLQFKPISKGLKPPLWFRLGKPINTPGGAQTLHRRSDANATPKGSELLPMLCMWFQDLHFETAFREHIYDNHYSLTENEFMRKRYREIAILILLFLPLATFAQTISPATPFNAEELDKHILQEMKASQIPGISLAIFSEEKIMYPDFPTAKWSKSLIVI